MHNIFGKMRRTKFGILWYKRSSNLDQTTRPCDSQTHSKKENLSADHRVMLKESKKWNKYLGLAREQK